MRPFNAASNTLKDRSAHKASKSGFTLLEMSIVLTLIGIIIGGGLLVLTANVQSAQFNLTVSRINTLHQALLNFATAYFRLPCPGDLTLSAASANYGYEAGAGSGSAIATGTGACSGTGMTPVATNIATSGTAEGAVPTRALKLPDDYMYDGWGHKFRYAVDPAYTKTGSLPAEAQCTSSALFTDTSGITVSDATGATRTSIGAYALVSHGANGHGAYTSSGTMMNAGSTNTSELANCNCSSSGAANGSYTPSYVQKAPTLDSTTTTDNFDDIVSYKDAWQLQSQNFQLLGTNCVFVFAVDQNNNRVELFNMNGNYATQFPCASGQCTASGTAGQLYGPTNIITDPSGKLWVNNSYAYRVDKFSPAGVYLNKTFSFHNGVNQMFFGIAADSSGNIWASSGAQIQEFDTNGNWLATLCNNYFGASPPTCTSGSANGYFNGVTGLTFDNSGNLWAVDAGNYRIQEFTNGSFVRTFGSNTSGNYQFWAPVGIAVDSGNNVWVTDGTGQFIKEFSNSGVWKATYSFSAGQNYIVNPEGIAIDSSNNIWFGDIYYNRLVEISSSTGQLIATYGSTGSGNGQFAGSYSNIYLAIGSR